MVAQLYPNGIGGSLGARIATCKPLQLSGSVWYVHHTGVNGVSPAGLNREKPLASIAQAQTNATAGDIIVFLSGHTQTLTAQQAFIKSGITYVGEGTVGGKPTVRFNMNHGSLDMFAASATGLKFRNILFGANAQSSAGIRLYVTGASCEVDECYFECGQFDIGAGLLIDADNFTLRRTTFISVATSSSAQPLTGASISGAQADLDVMDCVFDGGAYGFSSPQVLDLNATITRLRGEGNSFLRGADYVIGASSTGYFNPQTVSGGVRGVW